MKKIHQKEQEEATSMWEAGSIFFEVSSRDEAGHISAVHGDIPGGSGLKNLPAKTQERQETWVWLPGSGRSPGIGNINLLQCACLENSMDRGAWWSSAHGIGKSQTWPRATRSTCSRKQRNQRRNKAQTSYLGPERWRLRNRKTAKSLKLMSKISHTGISILPKADGEEIRMGSEKFSGQSKTNFSF